MENNQPLYIPENKRLKGLVTYCNHCKTNAYDCCKQTGKSLKLCPHGDKHVFKMYVHVPGTANQRKTKIFQTRDINEAIKQAIEFEQEVKGQKHQVVEKNEIKIEKKDPIRKEQDEAKPKLLIHALARYISWLHNEGVPAHRQRERSSEHIKDMERAFTRLVECLKQNGYNTNNVNIDDINDKMVGQVFTYLEQKNFSPRSFNKVMGYYTSFLKWFSDEYDYSIRNWFERVNRKKLNPKPQAITRNEFEALLNQIKPETGIKEYNGEVRNRNVYRTWLKDGIRLGLETGRRREEIINLKWNNIEESEGVSFIKTEDIKVNRIQARQKDDEKKFIFIPVTQSLKQLLDEMGYEQYKGSDKFILAPEIKMGRTRVMSDLLSRGFTKYYEQLGTGRKLTFKSLRKAYITNLQIFMGGGKTRSITGHSDSKVIETNYLDKKEIAKAMTGFNVFAKDLERKGELKELRKEAVNQQIERAV